MLYEVITPLDMMMNKDSVWADTSLTGIQKLDQHGTLCSIYRVGIFENNKRGMTAERNNFV